METHALPRLKKQPPRTALEKWMRDNGVTGSNLAEVIGVDKATISRAATGERSPGKLLTDALKRITGLKKLD